MTINQTGMTFNAFIDDDTMASATSTNISSSEAIKAYVDSVAGAGFTIILTARVATTAALTATYDNGTAGIGATLTNAGAQVALEIDDIALSATNRVLVTDQVDETENGVYTVTDIGSGATNWVLTRATDYDETSEIIPGTIVPVSSGTVNGGSAWVETATVTTIGTDDIVFSIFANPASTYVTIATNQTITGEKTFNANVALGNSATLNLNTSTSVDSIINDDTMATASATNLATAESIKAYVDSGAGGQVHTVVGTASEIDVDATDPDNPILSLSSTIDTPGTFTIGTTIVLDSIIDDDTFATATDTNIPTSESVKAYVDATVTVAGNSEVFSFLVMGG